MNEVRRMGWLLLLLTVALLALGCSLGVVGGGSGTVPATPAGLTVGGPTSASLAVSWSASAAADSYQVFRDTSAGGTFSTQVYSGTALSVTDSPLASDTTYYYKVQATNTIGSSARSAPVSGRTAAAAPGAPGTPAGLAVGAPTTISLTVSWGASTGADSYQVFRDTSASGTFATQAYSGTALSLNNMWLASDATYYYKVRATNTAGSSPLSAAVSGKTSTATSAGCFTSCHNASLPPDPLPTGRHTRHVSSAGYACDKCHHDYQTLSAHNNGTLQTSGLVFFDASNPSAFWTDSDGTCNSTSCHGSSKTW